jgi:hypothetical protein
MVVFLMKYVYQFQYNANVRVDWCDSGELDTGLQTVKTAPKGQYGDFMKRLNKDLEKRKSRRDTTGLTGAELRQLKQESIMNSSVLYQRRNQQKTGGLAPSPAIQPALSAM